MHDFSSFIQNKLLLIVFSINLLKAPYRSRKISNEQLVLETGAGRCGDKKSHSYVIALVTFASIAEFSLD